ncbi:MAG: hypothetical protein DCF16_09500 [Alphaproteobacteria bacterium]|nr:MAG: hypothetical protein DCF16_09500 [Alphaproteobacteria bacterium]
MMTDCMEHAALRDLCSSSLAQRGWRCIAIMSEGPGEVGVLYQRAPRGGDPKPELLVLQIAERITEQVVVARAQMMSDRDMVGVVTIVDEADAGPLVCDLSHDALTGQGGARLLLDHVERLERRAAERAVARGAKYDA